MESASAGLKIELPQPDSQEGVLKFLDEGIEGDESYSKPEDEPISRVSSEYNTATTTGSSGFESMDSGVRVIKYMDSDGKKKSPDRMKKRRFKKSPLIVENQIDSSGRRVLFSQKNGVRYGGDSYSTVSGGNLSSYNSSHHHSSTNGSYRSSEGILQNNTSGFYRVPKRKSHRGHRSHHSKDEKVIIIKSIDRNENLRSPKSKRDQKVSKKRHDDLSHHQKTETKVSLREEVFTTATATLAASVEYKLDNHRSKHQSSRDRRWFTPGEVIHRYGSSLSEYEKSEILHYKKIYYFGLGVEKSSGRTESHNNGFDNKKGEYKTVEHDHIAYRYEVLRTIGRGTFGEVVSAYDHKKQRKVALKIIRNRPNLQEQAQIEVKALKTLEKNDPKGKNFTLQIFDSFTFRNHPCIVCELIGQNLYEVLSQGNFQGLPVKVIRSVTKCILKCLAILSEESIIHCDIKPENILLIPGEKAQVKLIDFGSSCRESEQIYNYIQSRYYRAPEVIMGMKYTTSIDMWSLGCVLAELYTGTPLFPGSNEANQLQCIANLLGEPPEEMISKSPMFSKLADGKKVGFKVATSSAKTLDDEIGPVDPLFKDFIRKCLVWNPEGRMTVEEALKHPWIKHENPSKLTTEIKKTPSITQRNESPINLKDLHISSPSTKQLDRQDSGVSFEWLKSLDPKIRNNRYEKAAA